VADIGTGDGDLIFSTAVDIMTIVPKAIAEQKLALPGKEGWIEINVPVVDAKFLDGAKLYAPSHTIHVATRYPTFEDGSLVANKTQAQVAEFLKEYNEANKTDFRYPTLAEDEAMRDQLGRKHTMFDENFERNDQSWHWGYVADFTRPCGGKQVEGINGQMLVTRLVGYRLPEGEQILGVTAMAPSGMVSRLSRKQLEKMINAEGLKRLEELRGREIYEKGDEPVDVRNALGYPQFTFDHEAHDKDGKLLSHSHHVYTPGQNDGETVGDRSADWDERRDDRRCFCVYLDCGAGDSYSCRSFPLVRGGGVGAKVERPINEFTL